METLGQLMVKGWTSGAHFSDYGILVTRSDPTVAKHKGLTFFFVDEISRNRGETHQTNLWRSKF